MKGLVVVRSGFIGSRFPGAQWARFLLALGLILSLAGCNESEDYAWHQEIRLTVATPDGPVSASSVQAIEATYYPHGVFAAGTEATSDLRGEAVVVDLGAGRYLFALLDAGRANFAQSAYRHIVRGRPAIYQAIEAQLGKPPHPVPKDAWPQLVTFADIDDPTSVAPVDPDDLAASFGAGYALEAVTIAVTGAPVTEGAVEGVLGWLEGYNEWLTPVRHPTDNRPIGSMDFVMEITK